MLFPGPELVRLAVRVAVEELLGRAFVDRVQADERPRGYRRSGQGIVDMLVGDPLPRIC